MRRGRYKRIVITDEWLDPPWFDMLDEYARYLGGGGTSRDQAAATLLKKALNTEIELGHVHDVDDGMKPMPRRGGKARRAAPDLADAVAKLTR